VVADALAGRCAQFIAVSGVPVYSGYHDPTRLFPRGVPVGVREDAADSGRPAADAETPGEGFARKIRAAEEHVLAHHHAGAFGASLFRYPSIYGPRQVYPREWSVLRRVLDGRGQIILPDAGLTISTRCAAANAAAFLFAAVDNEAAAGEIFNVADRDQFTLRQWTELLASAAGGSLEVVSIPFEIAGPGRALFPIPFTDHVLVDTGKADALLGHREPVPAAQALAATAQWYLANPPDAALLKTLIDTFDYAAEDRLIAAFRQFSAELTAAQPEPEPAAVAHPYAHPKVAGAGDHRAR
jgi:nucleoside-diphosphate-sugar epimerase